MPWFNVDDQSHSHPKVIIVGNEAWGAFCRMGAYCAAFLTDGFVPFAFANMVCGDTILSRLVDHELLEKEDLGYRLHDYLDYNRPGAKVRKARLTRSKAGRLGGKRSAQAKREAKPQAKRQANATAKPQAKLKQTVKQKGKQNATQSQSQSLVQDTRPKACNNTKALIPIGSGGVGGETSGEPGSARSIPDLGGIVSQPDGKEPDPGRTGPEPDGAGTGPERRAKRNGRPTVHELAERVQARLARAKQYADPAADEKAKRKLLEKVKRGEA